MDPFDQPPEDSFNAGVPVRSPWPMANPQRQAALEREFFEDGATIHFDRLAQLPRWATTLGTLNMFERTQFIGRHVINLAQVTHRKLTQPEIDALAEAAARNYRRVAWVGPITVCLTAGAVYNGWQTFRFPLYTPKATWFHPESFPSKRLAFLTGKRATFAWHVLRSFAYYPLMKVSTGLFITSIAASSLRANILTDQRLRDVKDAMEKSVRTDVQRRQKEIMDRLGGTQPGAQRQQQHMDQSDQERRDETYRNVGLPPPSNEEIRNMSQRRRPFQPARAESQTNNSPNQETPLDWGVGDSQPTDSANSYPQQATSVSGGSFGRPGSAPARRPYFGGAAPPREQSQEPGQTQQTDRWDDSGLFDDDDASPVSTSALQAERKQAQPRDAQGASSWDRVRQRAKADTSPFARGDRTGQDSTWEAIRQGSGQTSNDSPRQANSESYTYTEAEATKDYAKTQAQKEFDDMLEAERKGTSDATGWRRSG